MSGSTIGQKPEKEEQAAAFNPTRWSEENGDDCVPAGKLQVLEKFFTPVQCEAKRREEWVYLPLQMESLDDRFSVHSSSSSTSTSSAMWSLEARLEKDALCVAPSQYRSSPSGPGGEGGVEGAGEKRLGGSFTPFVRGVGGTGDLPLRQGRLEFRPQAGQAEGLEQNVYKTTRLEHGSALVEEVEIPAPQQPSETLQHPLGRAVLRNRVVEEDGRLWKTRSSETVTERPTGTKPLVAPKPGTCQQRQQQPLEPSSPESLGLSPPKKSLILGENRRIEDKLRFSEFLDEVTRQIMSPSNLISLGWKTSRGSSPINRAPSAKSVSSESLPEKDEGKRPLSRRKRVGPSEAKGDATSIHPDPFQGNAKPARTLLDETSSSSESGLFAPFLADLPELSEEPRGARREGVRASEHVPKPKAQERPFKEAEEKVRRGAEKSDGGERSRSRAVAGKSQMLYKELLVKVKPKPSRSSQELPNVPVLDSKSVPAQQDLQRKWEETLETLKENYSRIQEEYSNTRHINQLLEEKLQRIVQTMAEERQTWNQRMAELERLIRLQNVFCVSEKINVSGLLPKSSLQAQPRGGSPMDLSSETLLDVIPPPSPFKDRDSSTRSSPAPADLTPESSKLGCSSELDPARSLGGYESHGPLAARSYLRPSPLSAWKPTEFCAECANVTEEEEYGREEGGLVCSPLGPCFLYLQEASAPSSAPSPLPDPELGAFPMLHPPYLSARPVASKHPAERSWWGRSDHTADTSRSPGVMEKTWRSRSEHQPRPKMLGSCGLTPEEEETAEKWAVWPRAHGVALHEEGSGEELPSPGETASERKLGPRLWPAGGMLPQVGKRGGRERQNAATD